ncbi:MAG: short-chain dehydrogenase [Verrucomicrobia bacterium]|nr:MAG: short-chain dehydrogenase [Verrucomicrobiota bacterium]
MRLQNKVTLITGGAHGIGKAIAEAFAREGARVFIADVDVKAGRQTAGGISEQGGEATFIKCDVSVRSHVTTAIKKVAREGRIDVLCNNAAYISSHWHGAADAPDSEWERSFRVSLLGTQYFTQAVLPIMLKHQNGSIINLSSIQGMVAGRTSAAYTSIKHALIGYTRSVACDYGPRNIRCNAICPGPITTRVSPKAGSELYKRQVTRTFLNRVGEPEEVASAAVFLASDEASYITGAVLAVDGGWTAI